ncbi:MAG: DNA repair protein RadA [Gammaproteobacteria bacterium]|nr:DNA repair protein RadA [Gammaproteobacteria bacterium]
MAKAQPTYVCGDCGAATIKWQGQCPACGEWNTLQTAPGAPKTGRARQNWAGAGAAQNLADVGEEQVERRSTGIRELDRALGGGLVVGSVTLIGGDPGIGKSTLLLQACVRQAGGPGGGEMLYVSGEESVQQIALRARRLGLDAAGVTVYAATDIADVIAMAEQRRPACVVVDSVQTVYTDALPSAPGSVNQLRECAAQLVRMAKSTGIAVILVGHVTKDGQIAGPRVLEHMVDTVLYFENEAGSRYRVLRTVKNRFGAANELGIFVMTDAGMREVRNPSAIFLSQHDEPIAGSVVTAIHQGSRPLLVEVQVLTDRSGGGPPRRVAVGLDQNRLALLLAALHRYGGIRAHDEDVFLNVVGGVKIAETSADLPTLVATVSSMTDLRLPRTLLVFGEVGLAGEIRPVPHGEERLREAAKLGLTHAIAPAANVPKKPIDGLSVTGVKSLGEALEALRTIG